MKVKFASQVISHSVASALLTMKDLNIACFHDVYPTVEYLKLFNDLFDCMNSRHMMDKYGKAPLSPVNEERWRELFKKTVAYICNL